jgi:hypothetical protein
LKSAATAFCNAFSLPASMLAMRSICSDTPFVSAGYAGAEVIFLRIEEFLIRIHACDPD